jgi:hypothetical protein
MSLPSGWLLLMKADADLITGGLLMKPEAQYQWF